MGGWPVRVVDATVINGPGAKAVPWRAHVLINPAKRQVPRGGADRRQRRREIVPAPGAEGRTDPGSSGLWQSAEMRKQSSRTELDDALILVEKKAGLRGRKAERL